MILVLIIIFLFVAILLMILGFVCGFSLGISYMIENIDQAIERFKPENQKKVLNKIEKGLLRYLKKHDLIQQEIVISTR